MASKSLNLNTLELMAIAATLEESLRISSSYFKFTQSDRKAVSEKLYTYLRSKEHKIKSTRSKDEK